MFTFSVGYIVYFLFVVDFRIITATDLEKGDKCSFMNGTQGVCTAITSCQPIFESLNHGVFPENICGFEGTKPLVCCKETISVTKRTPGEISRQKCKEYAQYAYKSKQSSTSVQPPHGRTRRIAIPQISHILECGFDKLELLDGGVATTFEFPHMALIGYQGVDEVRWLCGGSLISENFVLTAAHCLYTRNEGPAKFVRTGLTNRIDFTNMQERKVSDAFAHPEYKSSIKYHDIALLRVSKSFHLNAYTRPACLQSEKIIPFSKAIACGWGKTDFVEVDGSNELLKVVLDFFDFETCNRTFERNRPLRNGIIEDLMICAGSKAAGHDTCQGDSGGPLQVYHEDTEDIKCMYDIVGITSFGKLCGIPNIPAVYTRVSAYIKWIEDTVWP